MPQLKPAPKGLDGFDRFVDIPTGLPLFYRREGNAEVFVRFLDANTEASPMTILDSEAYSALAAATNYGLNLGEIQHQEAPIRGNSNTLAAIAKGEIEPIVTQAQSDADQFLRRPAIVDGASFTTPLTILGLSLVLAALIFAWGKNRRG
jgi:hypothetical protein